MLSYNTQEPMEVFGPRAPDPSEILLNAYNTTPEEAVNRTLQITQRGSIETAVGNTFYGLNHRQTTPFIPINKDYYGYTFFTRPRLNLTEENIYGERLLTPLLTKNPHSLQRIIRLTLDTELSFGRVDPMNKFDIGISCPFVDPHQAFIPLLSNNILSMSGWPDMRVETFTSQNGIFNESYSFIDNFVKFYGTFDITANFRNLPGDPISAMFMAWIVAASAGYMGTMIPYPDDNRNTEINYNTRIWRLVMDSDKRRVQKIAACGASFPYSVPMGNMFDYESDKPLNQGNEQVSINFKCMGAQYNDPILVKEFNDTVKMFNPEMRDNARDRMMSKVPLDALSIFNNQGYPRIDPKTFELDWYVSTAEFKRLMPILYRQQNPVDKLLTPRV